MSNETYYYDYPTEKIGDGNPYSRCCACGVSDPQINGRLEGHAKSCSWVAETRIAEARATRLALLEKVATAAREVLEFEALSLTERIPKRLWDCREQLSAALTALDRTEI